MACKLKKTAALLLILGILLTLVFSIPASAAIISNAGTYKVVLADYDDCLSPTEEADILAQMEKTAGRIDCHIGIVITADLEGLDDEGYAEYFGFDNFGTGSWIVLMLLNSHGNPAYKNYTDVIYSYDPIDDVFYDKHGRLFDRFYAGFDSGGGGNFYAGCKRFCSALNSFGGKGFSRVAIIILENLPAIFFGMIFAAILAFSIVMGTVKGYKKKKPISATAYLEHNRTNYTRREDIFLREYTSSHTTSSSSGGHHGGGGHHSGGHASHGRHR